ncbi:Teneurin-m [Nymphon striatum]|nr:Teneurin-m [Nymphon striatum]
MRDAIWTVDCMVNVIVDNVYVILDGLDTNVKRKLVIQDVKSMVNVVMGHAFASKDGMEGTALWKKSKTEKKMSKAEENGREDLIWQKGCPNNCHGNGDCQKSEEEWSCHCNDDWDGNDCSIPVEKDCDDGIDNDNDGLTDCADSECCGKDKCSDSQMCITSSDPLDILLRKQPPAVTASFFQKMRFLIEEESVQSYAGKKAFNDSRASVIRGQVISESGSGLVGIRVSVANDPKYGFTLTRKTGWFDLMVNGGGAVTLHFSRSPFKPRQQTVNVPWNEIIIIDQVTMTVDEEIIETDKSSTCNDHNYDKMKPVVLATWKHGFQGGCPAKSSILAESQFCDHTKARLHADDTSLTVASDNRNSMQVGYEYNACRHVIWEVRTTTLSGHDMSISEIGGWNLNIHHRYNFHEGILQKGDGSNIYLKHRPKLLLDTMGNGDHRQLECFECDGLAIKQNLLAPIALTSGPDGSIYVGDFNYIRRITADGMVKTIVDLGVSQVPYRYHLAVSPMDGKLYISDPARHQIFRVIMIDSVYDSKNNIEAVVGNGHKCVPGDKAQCGDGGPARDARLSYPKGIAVSAENTLYIADGTNIRMVDISSRISTLIGDHRHKNHWKPIPCEGTINADQVNLRWPTELAVNPLDGSLHVIDDHMILRVTHDKRLKVIAGRPLHCPFPPDSSINTASESNSRIILESPQSLAFSTDGNLYIAESDSQMINRVRRISSEGIIYRFAGADSKCSCLVDTCKCYDNQNFLASTAKFNTISSIAVTPDGIVHISDQGNLRLRSVTSSLPEPNSYREYKVFSPETQEVYFFNRFGQHISTQSILTGKTIYTFTYNVNTSFGKLSTITDSAGNKIYVLRDYNNQVNTIENTQGQKCILEMSRMGMLQQYVTPENFRTNYNYHGSSGLIKSKTDSSSLSYLYEYDKFGRITSTVGPSGRIIQLISDLSQKGASVSIFVNGVKSTTMFIKGADVTTMEGQAEKRTIINADGSVNIMSSWSSASDLETVPYSLLAEQDSMMGETFPVPAKMKTSVNGITIQRVEWRYYLRRDGKGTTKTISQVGRKLRVSTQTKLVSYNSSQYSQGVNGVNLLNIEYDREKFVESVADSNNLPLLTVHYDSLGRPKNWTPNKNLNLTGIELVYDRYGRLSEWIRGTIKEAYGYDRHARMSQITYADGTTIKYIFKDSTSILPTSIMLPSDATYHLEYDNYGSIKSIKTPVGHLHEVYIQPSLGFNRFVYKMPGVSFPYIFHIADDGKIQTKILPDDQGRVVYIYNNYGQLASEICGEYKIDMIYYNKTGLPKTALHTNGNNFVSRTDFKYHSGIVKEMRQRFSSRSGMGNAKFKYQYESGAELTSITGEIGGKEIPQILFQTNPETKLMEKIAQFGILYPKANSIFIQDDSRQYSQTRLTDSYNNLMLSAITIKGKVVFSCEVKYDIRGRVQLIRSKYGRDSGAYDSEYMYTIDGYLSKLDGKESWRFTHDLAGNIVSMSHNNQEMRLKHDDGGRMIRYDDIKLNVVDQRGFIIERSQEKFTYNSKGQLMSVIHNHQYGFSYQYDVIGRLVARKDHRGNVTQFFYSNPNNLHLLTHIHYPAMDRTFSLFYDDKNFLMYMQQSSSKYYIANDHVGSPVAVFNEEGDIIKEITRSPFGNTLSDTNQELYIPVDFMGGIRDPTTGIIHFGSATYDPLVMQWMTPQWQDLDRLLSNPHAIHLYRFMNNDPVNQPSPRKYYTTLEEWMPLLGYKTGQLLDPSVRNGFSTHLSMKYGEILMNNPLTVVPGLSCLARVTQSNFLQLSTIPNPAVKEESSGKNFKVFPKRVSAIDSFIGRGIIMTRVNNKAMVKATEGADGIMKDVYISVFNNSNFIDMQFSSDSKETFFFCKSDLRLVNEDMHQLQRLGSTLNVSKHNPEDANNQVELRVYSKNANLNIRYGTNLNAENRRVLRIAKRRAIHRAWDQEKRLVRMGKQGRRHWTKSEAEQLIKKGTVKGYTEITVHNIMNFPSLADDSTNIMIQKASGSNRSHRQKM